jgi:hypothetical protein
MQFSGTTTPPKWQLLLQSGNMWIIYADGTIDTDSGERLEQFIQSRRVPDESTIFLNSLGGSLIGGLNLGRVLRLHAFRTYIGRINGKPIFTPPPLENGFPEALPGECYSACALAFLGGKFRYIDPKSVYGVHRFSFAIQQPADSDVAQILSAAIVQYITEMGIDPELFTIMTKAASSDIITLSDQDLEKLGVINNGASKAVWTIESVPTGMYLKGQQDTVYGLDKFMILCAPSGDIALWIMFDPQKRGDELIKLYKADSLFIDDREIPMTGKEIEGPKLMSFYPRFLRLKLLAMRCS